MACTLLWRDSSNPLTSVRGLLDRLQCTNASLQPGNCQATAYVADGDSITFAQGLVQSLAYPNVMVAALTQSYNFVNIGVPGNTCTQRDTAATLPGGADQYLKNNQRAQATLSIDCGVNDLFGGATPAVAFSNLSTYITNRKAAGWKHIAVLTILDASTVSFANTSGLSALIVAGAGAGGYTVADVGSDANLGCNGCHANSTYFQADGVHPTAVGQALMETYLKTVVNGFGLN